MIFDGRSLSELSLSDLLGLIEKKVREDHQLAFKESAYTENPGEIHELLCDIIAIANSEGGYLIIGIQKDEQSCASGLSPIVSPNETVRAIDQACSECIQEPIDGLEIKAFDAGNHQGLIAVHIPSGEYRPYLLLGEHQTEIIKRIDRDKRPVLMAEFREQILNNPRFRRLIDAEFSPKGYSRSERPKFRTPESPYIRIYTEAVVEQFIKRYLITRERAQSLLIISPFIGDLSGELYSLKDILNRATADKTRVYVVTRTPKELYQFQAMDVLSACPYVEIRYNPDIHAKLYICWGRDEDDSFALFGSGNLTTGGLRVNLELGMMILARGHGKTLINDLYQWGSFAVRSTSEKVKTITA